MRSGLGSTILMSLLFVILLITPVGPPTLTETAGKTWSLEAPLEQIDQATKYVRGVTADVSVTWNWSGKEYTTEGTGKAYIRKDGRMRIDVEEPEPMTLLCTPSELQIYKLSKNPSRLAPYALLGFSSTGTELRKDYLVTLLEEQEQEGKKLLLFELTPKKEAVRSEISKIHLWIDLASWLPVQQQIFHSDAQTHLTVRYRQVTRDDALDSSLFKAIWPKGTQKVKM